MLAADDPGLISAFMQMRSVCAAIAEKDPAFVPLLPDPERDPAHRRLAAACVEFPLDAMDLTALYVQHPFQVKIDAGPERAVALARDWLATRDDYYSLTAAAELLLDEGRGPTLVNPPRGLIAITEALHGAAMRRECRASGGCGPDDARTLTWCAVHGCPPGSDLERAMRESLSSRDWMTLVAADRWYEQQRRVGR